MYQPSAAGRRHRWHGACAIRLQEEESMASERQTERGGVRIGAVGDRHYTKSPQPQRSLQDLFTQASRACDVLLLAGDLTDRGLPEEAQGLAREIHAAVNVPVIAVLGNHDFESGKAVEVREILSEAGIRMLDGEAVEVMAIGFAGTKGFCGGFGKRSLGPWGEPII